MLSTLFKNPLPVSCFSTAVYDSPTNKLGLNLLFRSAAFSIQSYPNPSHPKPRDLKTRAPARPGLSTSENENQPSISGSVYPFFSAEHFIIGYPSHSNDEEIRGIAISRGYCHGSRYGRVILLELVVARVNPREMQLHCGHVILHRPSLPTIPLLNVCILKITHERSDVSGVIG